MPSSSPPGASAELPGYAKVSPPLFFKGIRRENHAAVPRDGGNTGTSASSDTLADGQCTLRTFQAQVLRNSPAPPGAPGPLGGAAEAVAFAGGSVWCLDWCPRALGGTHFFAVGAQPAPLARSRGADPVSGDASVQLWALDTSPRAGQEGASLFLVAAWAHPGGKTWALKWEPGAGEAGAAGGKVDLGMLAVARGDGAVALYSAAVPEAWCRGAAPDLAAAAARQGQAWTPLAEFSPDADAVAPNSGVCPGQAVDVPSALDWTPCPAPHGPSSLLAVATWGGSVHLLRVAGAGVGAAGGAAELERLASMSVDDEPCRHVEILSRDPYAGRAGGDGPAAPRGGSWGAVLGSVYVCAGDGQGHVQMFDPTDPFSPVLTLGQSIQGGYQALAARLMRRPFLASVVCKSAGGLRIQAADPRMAGLDRLQIASGRAARGKVYEPLSVASFLSCDIAPGTSFLALGGEDGEAVVVELVGLAMGKHRGRRRQGAGVDGELIPVGAFKVTKADGEGQPPGVELSVRGRGRSLEAGKASELVPRAKKLKIDGGRLPADASMINVVRWGPRSGPAEREARFLAMGTVSGLVRVVEVEVPPEALWPDDDL